MKGKLTFLYDNGKTYTANRVLTVERDVSKYVTYSVHDKRTNIVTNFSVPVKDVAALVYKRGNETTAIKLKPCAVVNTTLEKL